MNKIWILSAFVFSVLLSTASMSFGLPVVWADTSNPSTSPIISTYRNINDIGVIAEGKSNLGSVPDYWDATIGNWVIKDGYDGNYMRLTSDGNFGQGTGNGVLMLAFDFFNQGSSNISQIVYTGHASEGVTAAITQIDFFSSAATNNMASVSWDENLTFITSPSEMCVANRLRTDGNYLYYNDKWNFMDGVSMFYTQPNFSFNDIVRVQYTFSITGFTAGKFFELDAVSNTNDPVPIAEKFAPVSIFFPQTTSVPEPATVLLFGCGLMGLLVGRRMIKCQDA
jgi:hypothetical protein